MKVGSAGQSLREALRLSAQSQSLRVIEQKVKAHELAHKSVGGELAGPVRYRYTKGPDGKLYITGGEVPLYLREGRTPEETIEIAQKVKRAALAPMNPSPQDRAIAAKATATEMRARMEMLTRKDEEEGRFIDLFF
ncbi:putative metalloprotease CJM1_0395 family protein [Hydrogenivirga sp.]